MELALALKGGNLEFALVLLKHGAQVTVKGNNNSPPLHLVSICGYGGFAGLLLEHYADVDVQDGHKSLESLSSTAPTRIPETFLG